MYAYKALVTRVVDGDTVYAAVDLGFYMCAQLKFRLSDIDTPELYRPINEAEKIHAREAKDFLSNLILDKHVTIYSEKTGKYGRWLAKIYIDGQSVSEALREAGFEKRSDYES